ncbi:MAG TPA: 5'/3'-nucleotidase SurE [Elusimicrobiota bacterium]|nr:5'/3'-nucleotidase SurE [Elusimicrobiota bacterium]
MRRNGERQIFVCNDDGIYAPGLKILARALSSLGRVTVVVPDQERSAASHAITLHKPIRVHRVDHRTYIINGTPADCVRFGVLTMLKQRVDIIVSGINSGPNLGADTIYSGTIGAAVEGTMLGIPSIAVSLAYQGHGNYKPAAAFSRQLAKMVLEKSLPRNICLNVNVPDRPRNKIKGVMVTLLGKRIYGKDFESGVDPRGQAYYWLAGATPSGISVPGSDITAIEQGKISVTPIRLDMTAMDMIPVFKQWKWQV